MALGRLSIVDQQLTPVRHASAPRHLPHHVTSPTTSPPLWAVLRAVHAVAQPRHLPSDAVPHHLPSDALPRHLPSDPCHVTSPLTPCHVTSSPLTPCHVTSPLRQANACTAHAFGTGRSMQLELRGQLKQRGLAFDFCCLQHEWYDRTAAMLTADGMCTSGYMPLHHGVASASWRCICIMALHLWWKEETTTATRKDVATYHGCGHWRCCCLQQGIVGVIGGNGAGKSTLFRMIVGQDSPNEGTLHVGETVAPLYVDQLRDALDPNKTVFEEITGGADEILLGERKVSSRAYCAWYNFKGADQQKKVGVLSGGERNRVHLARIMRRGGNLLMLDEPTNDLDVDTLRALEDAIQGFAGCVIVISHDRWFLDRIATHIMAFEGDSKVVWFEGSYSDYEEDRRRRLGNKEPSRLKYRALA
ncbi:unnamed protein product [Closterium sp. Yama58-4]|nr:unnamed protein product [Closterium sp. Yama58-4]